MSLVDEFIEAADRIIIDGPNGSDDAVMDFTSRVFAAYARELREDGHGGLNPKVPPSFRDVVLLRDWLRALKERREHEIATAETKVSISNSSNAYTAINMNVVNVIREIDKSDLPQDEKNELKNCLEDIGSSKNGGPRQLAEKIEKALAIAKNSAEAARAVIGLVQTIGPLLGA